MRAMALALAALAGAGAFAQDGKKQEPAKDRLPFFWKQLDLTAEQKAKYQQVAAEAIKKKEALEAEIEKLAAKVKELRAEYKKLDSGDEFADAILTAPQKEKLTAIKADAASRFAKNAEKKAAALKSKAGKPEGKKADAP